MHLWARVVGLVMAMSVAQLAAAIDISGVVRDSSGAPVRGAEVGLLTAELTGIARTKTDVEGKFSLPAPAPGTYLLIVRAEAFGESHHAVTVGSQPPTPLDIVIHPAGLREEVTVTASRGTVEDVRLAGQPVNIIGESEIATRVKTVVAQAVEGEAGVHLQRTSPTMAGIFVRGLTGNKVNVFVDGVRYSNGAQRGGVNTFLDLIEPDMARDASKFSAVRRARSTEAMPSGAACSFCRARPRSARLADRSGEGRWRVDAGSAHQTGGGNAFVAYMAAAAWASRPASRGRKAGGFRPGDGIDSHASVTRFFGIASNVLMDERLPDTGFEQYGGSAASRTGSRMPRTHIVVASYMRTKQDQRQAVRPAPRRRRQPDLRAERSVARSRSTRGSSGSARAGSTMRRSLTRSTASARSA